MTHDPERKTVIDQLLTAAIEADRGLRTRAELEEWLDDPDSRYPIARCHDWRNHVPDVVFEHWDDLPLEAKIVAFIPAASAAHWESWD